MAGMGVMPDFAGTYTQHDALLSRIGKRTARIQNLSDSVVGQSPWGGVAGTLPSPFYHTVESFLGICLVRAPAVCDGKWGW